jgi:4-alpha-glucanotransferase
VPRSSGVQLHPTSLPSGTLGRDAFRFVDWLAAAGQTWWQMLPLGPPDRHRSPYKARSAFAGWPGLLGSPRAKVTKQEELDFREREAYWIEDWAKLAGRDAVADQVRFSREWAALRAYAAERGVKLIGDIPIYVAPGSADHRAHPEIFREGVQAGTPPDVFAVTGQLWGNPVYDWPALQRTGYRWWIERLRHELARFDLVRIDHFRGFVAYWAVDAAAEDASGGRWARGPGRAVFDAASKELGKLPVIAEDLGVITEPVHRLRESLGFPGMAILQFGFDPEDPRGPHRMENHTRDRVVYTGTHDSDTVVGWYRTLPEDQRAAVDAAREPFSRGGREGVEWSLIRLLFSSRGDIAMIQAQDVLGLGTEARMNVPGTKGSSWRWQLQAGALKKAHAERLREATAEAGRLAT